MEGCTPLKASGLNVKIITMDWVFNSTKHVEFYIFLEFLSKNISRIKSILNPIFIKIWLYGCE